MIDRILQTTYERRKVLKYIYNKDYEGCARIKQLLHKYYTVFKIFFAFEFQIEQKKTKTNKKKQKEKKQK